MNKGCGCRKMLYIDHEIANYHKSITNFLEWSINNVTDLNKNNKYTSKLFWHQKTYVCL